MDGLNLAAAGLESDDRGRIKVDENYRAAQPNILAVGDVIGFPSLASVSMAHVGAPDLDCRTAPEQARIRRED